jgi:hypothetical protein
VRGRKEVRAAVERTEARFNDPVSSALRECLRGGDLTQSLPGDLPVLEALRHASGLLTDVEGLSRQARTAIPTLDREIGMRRLFAPLERMVGESPGSADVRRDRFFGRHAELEKLRSYVGVVRADSLLQQANRAFSRASGSLFGRAPLTVWGVGGVGKTTLIAKFMLEHVRAAEWRFPFAYLDFDRPTVSARKAVRRDLHSGCHAVR